MSAVRRFRGLVVGSLLLSGEFILRSERDEGVEEGQGGHDDDAVSAVMAAAKSVFQSNIWKQHQGKERRRWA